MNTPMFYYCSVCVHATFDSYAALRQHQVIQHGAASDEVLQLVKDLAELPKMPMTLESWCVQTIAWNNTVEALVRRAKELELP